MKVLKTLSVYSKKMSHQLKRSGYQFKTDLGISSLIGDWKKIFKTNGLKQDTISGLTVACIALPLSLAIALASGVKPEIGLISAIVGGIVAAFFGGTPLAVTGPAAAMAVIISAAVQTHGLSGLLIIGLGCGILQVLTGVFRLGRFIQFVPTPVIAGFTAGIGAIILIGQLPVALGLPAPEQSKVINVILHLFDFLHQTKLQSTLLASVTLAIIFVLPKITPKLPAPLIGVVVGSLIAVLFQMDVKTIGAIPNSLPLPQIPALSDKSFFPLASATFIVFAIASLETLLSSSAVDKLLPPNQKHLRHNPDQELIGQGLSNAIVSLFGGIPVTGVIARSALNIQSGAKSRRSAIVHSIALILCVYFFAPFIGKIPIPVLAGVLLSVSLRMLNPKEFLELLHLSKADSLIYLVTFVAIVLVDLIAGVQAGMVAALFIASLSLGRTKARIHFFKGLDSSRLAIDGSLSFMSVAKIEMMKNALMKGNLDSGLIIDLSKVTVMDSSGGQQFVDLIKDLLDNGVKIALRCPDRKIKKTLLSLDSNARLVQTFAESEVEALAVVGNGKENSSLDRLKSGVERFRNESRPSYQPLFDQLAKGQKPHTMLITCSDSRINPNLITSTDPGEIFIVRNVGNIIPKFGEDQMPAEGAAIEFALGVLEVEHIIVCGHSECGAMKEFVSGEIFKPENSKRLPSVSKWLSALDDIKSKLPPNATPNHASELNVLHQIQNLKTYPMIQEKLKAGKIKIHAWYYDISKADLEEWNDKVASYMPVR